MNTKELLLGIENCPCGKAHRCPIDYVEIYDGAIKSLKALCQGYDNVLMVCDKNTYAAAGYVAEGEIKDKLSKLLILGGDGNLLIPDEEAIKEIKGFITDKTDLIIGVGSGVINDLCKYTSFENNLPYYIIATAPSMDGYASVGAALILGGMKVTLNARPPKAIIADSTILANAPYDMIMAGYGDIIGKFSCLGDWKISAVINDEYFCHRVYELTYETAEKVKVLAEGIKARSPEAIAKLMEALVTVGIAMSFVGNSRPASGSEHHLSHFFEITGILEGKEYFAHGIDVAYSAIATAMLREKMLSKTPKKKEFIREAWEENIRRVYSTSADGVIALQDKLGWYSIDKSKEVYEKWEDICDVMKKMPSSADFIDMTAAVGLDYKEFEALYGKEKIEDAILYSKDLKDRYTVLWLNYLYF